MGCCDLKRFSAAAGLMFNNAENFAIFANVPQTVTYVLQNWDVSKDGTAPSLPLSK